MNSEQLPAFLSLEQENRVADWISLAQPVLARFHIRLDDLIDSHPDAAPSFAGSRMEKRLVLATAVTALGTWLYGKRGQGRGLEKDKSAFNLLKKQADAISAYILQEALFFSTRGLPENHAIMVSLGEGAMPKAGETPEQGANPQLAFGRVFARPEVSLRIEEHLATLLEAGHGESKPASRLWDEFWANLQRDHITVWGAAIDTLENTTRFTRGDPTGPMVVLHIFDQPLALTSPYESYMGVLTIPKRVVSVAGERSLAINYLTPRKLILEAIREAYPSIPPENVHVWTLGGPTRANRIGKLWDEWRALGVNIVPDGWRFPDAGATFSESGTYAPVYRVGTFDNGERLFLIDGYAASAEAIQAASLDPVRDLHTSLCLFTPEFTRPYDEDLRIMRLDPEQAGPYREMILDAHNANIPAGQRTFTVDDFFPNKRWRCLALSAPMLTDPYTNLPGIQPVEGEPDTYRVTVRLGERVIVLTIALELPDEESKTVFYPLLDRLYEDPSLLHRRPLKSSDIGRILNELRTWSWNSVIRLPDASIRIDLSNVDEAVIPTDKKALILQVLDHYRRRHPALLKHVVF